jgi:GNAT superfamily N-acetyltransferase
MTLWLQNPDPEGRIVLALNEGAIVGWALCSQYKGTGCSPDDPLTLNVFVCPDFRRRGIGRALFDSLNFEARGASMWTGFHDEPSFKFWRAMASRFWPMADICGDFRSSGRH